MSERGTYVTGFIYCPKCRAAVGRVLLGRPDNHVFTALDVGYQSVWAGRVCGLYPREELDFYETTVGPAIAGALCVGCALRVGVLADGGSAVFFLRRLADGSTRIIRRDVIEPVLGDE